MILKDAANLMNLIFQSNILYHLTMLTHVPLSIFICISISTVRNMDSTGRGYLTNDKVYALMMDQMKLQKDVFQKKKIITG